MVWRAFRQCVESARIRAGGAQGDRQRRVLEPEAGVEQRRRRVAVREAGRRVAADQQTSYVCLTPRGLEEGAEVDLAGRPLQLLTNRPVRFRLFSSAQREGDRPGAVLQLPAGELSELPPLYTVLRHPRSSQARPIAVTLAARLTEIGTLELWAVACEPEPGEAARPESEGPAAPLRWRLQFDLRSTEGTVDSSVSAPPLPATAESAAAEPVAATSAEQAGLLTAAAEQLGAGGQRDAFRSVAFVDFQRFPGVDRNGLVLDQLSHHAASFSTALALPWARPS